MTVPKGKRKPFHSFRRPGRFDVRERRDDKGNLIELVLANQWFSDGLRGPTELVRELHFIKNGNDWTIKISGPRGGPQEDMHLPRAGIKKLLNLLIHEV